MDGNAISGKHRSLSTTLVELLAQECGEHVQLISPADYDKRGAHVAFRCPDPDATAQRLLQANVVCTYRTPDVLRFGLAPLSVTHSDLWEAVARLKQILQQAR